MVRITDGSAGLALSTVRRRLSTLSGFYAHLVALGEVESNPVQRGMAVRSPVAKGKRVVPLVRPVRHLPRVLDPAEVIALMGGLRKHRDRAIVEAMLLAGLRRSEALGLRMADVRWGERRLFIADGKGGHQRLVPISSRFFTTLRAYLDTERPADATTDRVFVVLKGPNRGQPLTAEGSRGDHHRRPPPGRADPRHLSRAAPHLFHPAARGRHGAGSVAGPGRSPLDVSDPGVSASGQRLARRRVQTCC